MNEELFNQLVSSVRQGGKILRGQLKPKRQFRIRNIDVKVIDY